MKLSKISLLLLIFSLYIPASKAGISDIEIIINEKSHVVTGKCESRTCVLYPREGTTLQEFKDEVSYIRSHLNGMGVETKEDFIWPKNLLKKKNEKLSQKGL